jgi:EmrB/QacA subfamily drug resistance transporter
MAHRWAILVVLATVAFMAQLDFFIVNVALDGIGDAFRGASLAGLSWVLDAYAIVVAALLVPAGRFADLWGRKRVLLSGIAIFTVASAACAAAPSLAVLVAARAAQAVGAAMVIPTSLGLLYPSFPQRQHGLVVGIWAAAAATAASVGPPVGGLLVGLSWRWIFVINLPIGIAVLVAGSFLLPEVREPRGARLPDLLSVVALPLAVGLGVLATVQGPEWGWSDPRVIGLFVLAALAAALEVQRTLRANSPVIERRLFDSAPFSAASIALLLFYVGLSIFVLGCPLFMQNVWHYSALEAGVGITPCPIFAVIFSIAAGPIQHRFGRTLPALIGTSLMAAVGIVWISRIGTAPDYAGEMLPGLILLGVAGGLAQAPLFAASGTLPAERATTGSGVLNMSRQIGSAAGVAVLIALTSAAGDPLVGFQRAWGVLAGAGIVAAATLALFSRSDPLSTRHRHRVNR